MVKQLEEEGKHCEQHAIPESLLPPGGSDGSAAAAPIGHADGPHVLQASIQFQLCWKSWKHSGGRYELCAQFRTEEGPALRACDCVSLRVVQKASYSVSAAGFGLAGSELAVERDRARGEPSSSAVDVPACQENAAAPKTRPATAAAAAQAWSEQRRIPF